LKSPLGVATAWPAAHSGCLVTCLSPWPEDLGKGKVRTMSHISVENRVQFCVYWYDVCVT